ncbi:MAG: hypothetical protein H2040_10140 [Euryhalocaulis sp.]|uniref:diacylglycerol/lipid kinase family protein n=1 Tax=Euryhalocaulis sp. TaxID=2744307 RepID=UPI0017A27A72|nr:diacylglycerol kinase family protein [Euryhalocaulis sp.]MBA4802211.1 hypothetical protein [Euryhalocaulis sp.]
MTVRIGYLRNALSQRNRGRGAPADAVNADFRVLESIDQLDAHLQAFADAGIEILIIDGGDGTVQAVLTWIYGGDRGWRPRLAVVPGGMTNLIAHDVGLKGDPGEAAMRLSRGGGELATRAVMRVRHGAEIHCGMFFSAGAPLSTIELCRRDIHSKGFQASLAVGATLAFVAGRRMLNPTREDEIFRPYQIAVTPPDGETDTGPQLLFMAATTDGLMVGANPFWGGDGAIKATWAHYPAKRFLRRLPALYRGREPKGDDVYQSRSGDRFSLRTGEPFILDGEIYSAPEDGEIILDHAGDAEFVR